MLFSRARSVMLSTTIKLSKRSDHVFHRCAMDVGWSFGINGAVCGIWAISAIYGYKNILLAICKVLVCCCYLSVHFIIMWLLSPHAYGGLVTIYLCVLYILSARWHCVKCLIHYRVGLPLADNILSTSSAKWPVRCHLSAFSSADWAVLPAQCVVWSILLAPVSYTHLTLPTILRV